MVIKVDLSSNASVKLVCVDEENTAAAYLANLYIPIFTLDTGKVLRKYEVSNQIVGLSFNVNKKKVLYAIDDSFGLHVFDVRSESKKKYRLNPDVENHNVVCTALSSENILAVSSSEFGGGILDVRGSRHREHHPHVITLFDIRNPGEPITTYNKRHTSEITSMEFYRNGHDLLTGDMSGAIKSFNCQLRDEDNAMRWERWAKGPITKVGVINKRIVYSVSARSEATVFVDSKGNLETLYGVVKENADDPIVKTSKAYYKKPEFCVGLIKGVNDEIPLVAVHGVENKKFLSLTAMNQTGIRQAKPMLSYPGHVGEVKCMTVTPELLLTGGEDGKVVIQFSNFKNPKFGDDMIDHHHLTLNRQRLAELHDAKQDSDASDGDNDKKDDEDDDDDKDDSDDSSSESSDSDSDDGAGPSTSTKSKGSASKKDKAKEKAKKKADEEKEKAKKKAEEEKEKAKKKAEEEKEKAKKKAEEEKEKAKEKAKKKAEEEKARKKAEEEKEKAKKEAKTSSTSKKEDSKPSTSSSSKKETKEERQARKEKEAKEKERAEKKAKKEDAKRAAEREERRKMKEEETKEERAARKEKERRERQELERKEKERAGRKKKHDDQGSSSESKKSKKH